MNDAVLACMEAQEHLRHLSERGEHPSAFFDEIMDGANDLWEAMTPEEQQQAARETWQRYAEYGKARMQWSYEQCEAMGVRG